MLIFTPSITIDLSMSNTRDVVENGLKYMFESHGTLGSKSISLSPSCERPFAANESNLLFLKLQRLSSLCFHFLLLFFKYLQSKIWSMYNIRVFFMLSALFQISFIHIIIRDACPPCCAWIPTHVNLYLSLERWIATTSSNRSSTPIIQT